MLVLVKRGECSFTDKALHVQQAGGAGMLVFNNEPGVHSGFAQAPGQVFEPWPCMDCGGMPGLEGMTRKLEDAHCVVF